MNVFDKAPAVDKEAFVAPNASTIGDVQVGQGSFIWYGCVLRGTDILWAGMPMITLPLEKMATRVAGSLCLATELRDEMIVNSMKGYEERAVSLALNRPKLEALTNKLKAVRLTCPLFDTARWMTNLERGYFKMWNLHCSGQRPQHFKVIKNDIKCPYDR